MFFYPWYPALMLAVDTHNVIDMRLFASGSVNSAAETRPMVIEKIDAVMEAGVDDA